MWFGLSFLIRPCSYRVGIDGRVHMRPPMRHIYGLGKLHILPVIIYKLQNKT